MGFVDFILNLAGLLLWINWRAAMFDPLGKRTPATLIGTLRRAAPANFAALASARGHRRAAGFARAVLLADRPGGGLDRENWIWASSSIFFRSNLFRRDSFVFRFQFCADVRNFLFVAAAAFDFVRAAMPIHRLVKIAAWKN